MLEIAAVFKGIIHASRVIPCPCGSFVTLPTLTVPLHTLDSQEPTYFLAISLYSRWKLIPRGDFDNNTRSQAALIVESKNLLKISY